MLSILVPALWILYDVGICIRSSYMTGPLPQFEWWCWLIGGFLLAALAVFAGWWDRKQAIKDATRRHDEIQGAQGILAEGSIAILNRLKQLATVTQTTGQPEIAVIEAATARIQTLQAEMAELRTSQTDLSRMFWRQFTDRERALLKGLFEGLDRHIVRVVHTGQADCAELAGGLRQISRSAEWEIDDQGADTGTWETAGMSGIHVLGKYLGPDAIGSKVMNVLRPFIVGGIGYVASLENNDRADVSIVIGPKMARSSQP